MTTPDRNRIKPARKTAAKKKAAKKPNGRPTSYTRALADRICADLSLGKSLRKICADEDIPHQVTVIRWLQHQDRDDFRIQYARAREAQADFHADEMIDIADDVTATSESVAKAKLQIDTRKWTAAKMRPKKYGERAKLEVGGTDGAPIEVAVPNSLDLARRIAFILTKAQRDATDQGGG